MKRIRISIIGGEAGMGKWFAEYFRARGCAVRVSGKNADNGIPALVRNSNIVVISVPIRVTGEVIRKVGPHMGEDALLMDLTSLKMEPVRAMLESSVSEVIGLHPLFGPSVPTLQGENIFVCVARGQRWFPWLKDILLQDGGRLVETTPEKHDEMMAHVQTLTHLGTVVAGLVLRESGIDQEDFLRFSTPAFRAGIAMMDRIFRVNPRLYGDILALNPRASSIAEAFQRNLSRIRGFIDEQDAEGLTRWIQGI
jgi:prephenate dehydrogenase